MTVLCWFLCGVNLRYAFRKDFDRYGKIGAIFYSAVFALVALGFAR